MTVNSVYMSVFPQYPAISGSKTPVFFFLTSVSGTKMYGCYKNVEHCGFLILKSFSNYCLFTGNILTAVMNLSVITNMPETMAAYK